jgi:putative transposase
MRYQFIKENESAYKIEVLCKQLEVSRSGYYAWHHRPQSQRAIANQGLTEAIIKSFEGSRKTYGYRRVHRSLQADGKNCGKHRVARLMKKQGLQPKTKRKFKATTNSNHPLPIKQNHLQREFMPSQINRAWVSDITYIATQEGWLYLAAVMDLCSRQIIGWAMESRMTEDLVKDALKMALFRRHIASGLLLHSDRGSQYASGGYQQLLSKYGIVCSMSRKGNCWDNAPMESFFRSLKVESLYHQTFKTREAAKLAVFDYIEVFYNRQRRHSTLNYLSPVDYEKSVVNL